MEELGVTFLLYLYYFGRPAILVAGMVLGVVIICTKDNITKLLGAMITIGSISGLIKAAYDVGLRFVGAQTAMALTNAFSITSTLFAFVSSIFLYI